MPTALVLGMLLTKSGSQLPGGSLCSAALSMALSAGAGRRAEVKFVADGQRSELSHMAGPVRIGWLGKWRRSALNSEHLSRSVEEWVCSYRQNPMRIWMSIGF